LREVYLVESVRTPIAKAGKKSWFANIRADDLAALVLNDVLNRVGITGKKREQVDDAAINVGANTDIYSGLLFEKYAQTIAFSTEDRLEGTSAFLEKRKADFKGK